MIKINWIVHSPQKCKPETCVFQKQNLWFRFQIRWNYFNRNKEKTIPMTTESYL